MTSHFDSLMLLWRLSRDGEFPKEVFTAILTAAIKELDSINPKKITWEKWLASGTIYARLYKENKAGLIETQVNFVNDMHDVLDHDGGYHLRCFSTDFLTMLEYVKHLVRCGSNAEEWELLPCGYGQKKFNNKIKPKYPEIFKAISEHGKEIKAVNIMGW